MSKQNTEHDVSSENLSRIERDRAQSESRKIQDTKRNTEGAKAGEDYETPSQLHGEPFLETLNEDYAAQVKAIAQGRVPLSFIGKSKGVQERTIRDVLRYKPDFDVSQTHRPAGKAQKQPRAVYDEGIVRQRDALLEALEFLYIKWQQKTGTKFVLVDLAINQSSTKVQS
jgi:hypothetical protein